MAARDSLEDDLTSTTPVMATTSASFVSGITTSIRRSASGVLMRVVNSMAAKVEAQERELILAEARASRAAATIMDLHATHAPSPDRARAHPYHPSLHDSRSTLDSSPTPTYRIAPDTSSLLANAAPTGATTAMRFAFVTSANGSTGGASTHDLNVLVNSGSLGPALVVERTPKTPKGKRAGKLTPGRAHGPVHTAVFLVSPLTSALAPVGGSGAARLPLTPSSPPPLFSLGSPASHAVLAATGGAAAVLRSPGDPIGAEALTHLQPSSFCGPDVLSVASVGQASDSMSPSVVRAPTAAFTATGAAAADADPHTHIARPRPLSTAQLSVPRSPARGFAGPEVEDALKGQDPTQLKRHEAPLPATAAKRQQGGLRHFSPCAAIEETPSNVVPDSPTLDFISDGQNAPETTDASVGPPAENDPGRFPSAPVSPSTATCTEPITPLSKPPTAPAPAALQRSGSGRIAAACIGILTGSLNVSTAAAAFVRGRASPLLRRAASAVTASRAPKPSSSGLHYYQNNAGGPQTTASHPTSPMGTTHTPSSLASSTSQSAALPPSVAPPRAFNLSGGGSGLDLAFAMPPRPSPAFCRAADEGQQQNPNNNNNGERHHHGHHHDHHHHGRHHDHHHGGAANVSIGSLSTTTTTTTLSRARHDSSRGGDARAEEKRRRREWAESQLKLEEALLAAAHARKQLYRRTLQTRQWIAQEEAVDRTRLWEVCVRHSDGQRRIARRCRNAYETIMEDEHNARKWLVANFARWMEERRRLWLDAERPHKPALKEHAQGIDALCKLWHAHLNARRVTSDKLLREAYRVSGRVLFDYECLLFNIAKTMKSEARRCRAQEQVFSLLRADLSRQAFETHAGIVEEEIGARIVMNAVLRSAVWRLGITSVDSTSITSMSIGMDAGASLGAVDVSSAQAFIAAPTTTHAMSSGCDSGVEASMTRRSGGSHCTSLVPAISRPPLAQRPPASPSASASASVGGGAVPIDISKVKLLATTAREDKPDQTCAAVDVGFSMSTSRTRAGRDGSTGTATTFHFATTGSVSLLSDGVHSTACGLASPPTCSVLRPDCSDVNFVHGSPSPDPRRPTQREVPTGRLSPIRGLDDDAAGGVLTSPPGGATAHHAPPSITGGLARWETDTASAGESPRSVGLMSPHHMWPSFGSVCRSLAVVAPDALNDCSGSSGIPNSGVVLPGSATREMEPYVAADSASEIRPLRGSAACLRLGSSSTRAGPPPAVGAFHHRSASAHGDFSASACRIPETVDPLMPAAAGISAPCVDLSQSEASPRPGVTLRIQGAVDCLPRDNNSIADAVSVDVSDAVSAAGSSAASPASALAAALQRLCGVSNASPLLASLASAVSRDLECATFERLKFAPGLRLIAAEEAAARQTLVFAFLVGRCDRKLLRPAKAVLSACAQQTPSTVGGREELAAAPTQPALNAVVAANRTNAAPALVSPSGAPADKPTGTCTSTCGTQSHTPPRPVTPPGDACGHAADSAAPTTAGRVPPQPPRSPSTGPVALMAACRHWRSGSNVTGDTTPGSATGGGGGTSATVPGVSSALAGSLVALISSPVAVLRRAVTGVQSSVTVSTLGTGPSVTLSPFESCSACSAASASPHGTHRRSDSFSAIVR